MKKQLLMTVALGGLALSLTPVMSQAGLNSDGTWTVKRGDTLYSIGRGVAPGNGKEQARVRKYVFENNPNAFKNGDPGALEVGHKLSLPGAPVAAKPKPKAAPKPVPKPVPVAPPSPAPAAAAAGAGAAAVKAVTPGGDSGNKKLSFKERLAAKRAEKEAQDKAAAQAAESAAAAKAAEEARLAQEQAAAQAEAQRKAAAAEQARIARQKAEAERKAAAARAAAQQAAAKPKPAPKPVSRAATKSDNPYVPCSTSDPNERCDYWK